MSLIAILSTMFSIVLATIIADAITFGFPFNRVDQDYLRSQLNHPDNWVFGHQISTPDGYFGTVRSLGRVVIWFENRTTHSITRIPPWNPLYNEIKERIKFQ